MSKTSQKSHESALEESLPWIDYDPDMDRAVTRLVSTLRDRKNDKNKTKISEKDKRQLLRDFKNAEQAQSRADKYMYKLAEALGLDPTMVVKRVDMKDWDRALDKRFNSVGRNLHDLGRGTIYLKSVEDYYALQSLLSSKTKTGIISSLGIQGVRILEGSMDDYLANPRSSGFAGSMNMDLEINLGKQKGTFEIQFRPADYEEIDKQSHLLFDMIRVLQDVPESYLTKEDKKIEKALVLANTALFVEQAHRTGFAEILPKDNKKLRITEKDYNEAHEVLDRLRTEIENLPGRPFKNKKATAESLSIAKTSIDNIYRSQTRWFGAAARLAEPEA